MRSCVQVYALHPEKQVFSKEGVITHRFLYGEGMEIHSGEHPYYAYCGTLQWWLDSTLLGREKGFILLGEKVPLPPYQDSVLS